MEVILLESIHSLGRKGQVVKVKDGFGRNYLLPQHKAMPVNPDTLNRLKNLKKRFELEEAKLVSELQELAKALGETSIEMAVKATQEGHLFGSVNASMISQELDHRGFKILDRNLRIAEPIKSVGTYTVTARLHPDVDAEFTVVVDSETGLLKEWEEQERAKAEAEAAAAAEASAEGEAGEGSGDEASAEAAAGEEASS